MPPKALLPLPLRDPQHSRWPRRATPLAVLGVVVAVAISGCSSEPARPPKPIVATCGEFLALSPDDQAYAYKGLKWEYYSATHAGKVKQNEIFAEACPTSPPEMFLSDVLNAADDANCDLFSTLGPDMQTKWLDEIGDWASYNGPVELTAQLLLAACAGFQEKDARLAALLLRDYPSFGNWTMTTTLGYSETMTLAIGPLASGDSPKHPRVSDFIAGEACGYDPTKDAAIPFIVRVTNTTTTGAMTPIASFGIRWDDDADLTTSVAMEGLYGSPTCLNNTIPLEGSEKKEPGDGVTGYYFVILKNFFSPLHPDGAYGELASYQLVSARPLITDGIADITTLTMTLDVAGR